MGNRMEAKLYDMKDLERYKEDVRDLKKEIKALELAKENV